MGRVASVRRAAAIADPNPWNREHEGRVARQAAWFGTRLCQPFQKLFDAEADIAKLPIEQTHLRKQEQYMFTSCFARTRRQYKWSLFQG
jgi:hypothetical protein